jgi:formylglycine-generating enzyme required for sulfatase activity
MIMKKNFALLFALITGVALAQNRITVLGDVKDSNTGQPLAYATIGVSNHVDQTISDSEGKFEFNIPGSAKTDTLIVTYLGYSRFGKPVALLASFEHVLLTEFATLLNEVTIVHRQLDLRDVDRDVRVIRNNLYAMDHEVTNIEYYTFLSSLEEYGKTDLKSKYDFKLNTYPASVKEFYQRYHKPGDPKRDFKRNRRDSVSSFNSYPAVNITYEAAVEYCRWLTEQYNENKKKKKFRKVLFRLPTLNEWQIAALGDPKFQSWQLRDNMVEVIIAKDTMNIFKGEKKIVKVDDTILYPWYKVYFMRSRVYNQFGCYLGNFKIDTDRNCPSRALAYDGFSMMARTRSYFPNNMGLYDVCGNVAEMIDEEGKACGGSWNELPEKGTIQSVKTYDGPDETVGFRVFMEVLEK